MAMGWECVANNGEPYPLICAILVFSSSESFLNGVCPIVSSDSFKIRMAEYYEVHIHIVRSSTYDVLSIIFVDPV